MVAERVGETWSCVSCGAAVRSYAYRFHPPESSSYERCIGFSWCSGCRLYSAAMVHIPRDRVLVDALAELPEKQREELERSEWRLIEYLSAQPR
jgi:hypothetical protein